MASTAWPCRQRGQAIRAPGAPDPEKILPRGPLQAAVMPASASVCITPTLTLLKKSRLPSPLWEARPRPQVPGLGHDILVWYLAFDAWRDRKYSC